MSRETKSSGRGGRPHCRKPRPHISIDGDTFAYVAREKLRRGLPGAALEDADLVREPCPRQLQQGTVEAAWNHPPQGGRGSLGPTVGFHRL
jgi:hypothetical protein